MKKKNGIILTILAACSLLANADGDGLNEALFLGEMPTVLTASRVAQSPLDAPAPVTVIDREMIRASGFTEIHDLLRLVPGYLVAEWPEGGPVVVNHGMGDAYSRRLQVLVDGRSVYDPLRGGVDWQDLPLRVEDIERIEVVRGPNQASYGANAFQGVINIITREPGLEPGASVLVSRGIRGREDYYGRVEGGSDAWDWRVSASSRELSSFRDLGMLNYSWQEVVQRQTLNAQAAYRPEGDQEWRFQLGLSQGEDDVGRALAQNSMPFHSRQSTGRFLQVGWRNAYASDSELSVQYYHFSRRESEAFKVVGAAFPAGIPVNLDVDMRRDDLEFQQNHAFSDTLRGMWGAGLRHDSVKSEHYLYGLGTVSGTQWQVFGNLDWQVAPAWLLHLGGMVEKHYYTDVLFSPRVAANFTVAPNHVLRLSAGCGYRAPTIFEATAREVYPYNGGVADVGFWSYLPLEPEQVTFRELGYVGSLPAVNLRMDARLFVEEYKDYLDSTSCNLEPFPGNPLCVFPAPAGYSRPAGFGHRKAFYYYNSGGLRVHGVDATLDWRHPLLGRFVASHAYTRVSAGAYTDQDAEVSAPVHATSLLWMKAFPGGFSLSSGFYQMGLFKWPNDGDEQWPHRRWDVKVAKRLGKAGSEDEIAFTLQNFNQKHTEFDDYMLERQAFVTLLLSW